MVSEIYAPSALGNPISDIVGQGRESQRSSALYKFYVKRHYTRHYIYTILFIKSMKVISVYKPDIIFYIKELFFSRYFKKLVKAIFIAMLQQHFC
jgi:hypothetical protein